MVRDIFGTVYILAKDLFLLVSYLHFRICSFAIKGKMMERK